MSTVDKKRELEQEGVDFYREPIAEVWVAVFAGTVVSQQRTLGDCVWQAAEYLDMN